MKNFKKLSLIIVANIFAIASETKLIPQVDERVMTTAIICRLEGFEEYNDNYLTTYANAINSHFANYKNHEVIGFAKKLRIKNISI